jgi:hypothetical protein
MLNRYFVAEHLHVDHDDDNNDDDDTDVKEHIKGGDRGVKRQAFFMGPPGKLIKKLKKERRRYGT